MFLWQVAIQTSSSVIVVNASIRGCSVMTMWTVMMALMNLRLLVVSQLISFLPRT